MTTTETREALNDAIREAVASDGYLLPAVDAALAAHEAAVKAEALREAASTVMGAGWLLDRADRIEQEAGL